MIQYFPDFSIKNFSSFGIDSICKRFIIFEELSDLISYDGALTNAIFLGGGSNMIFEAATIPELFHYNKKGKTIIGETDNYIDIRVDAAENWHEFVLWCIGSNYGGIENLSLIPGTVGASPIQNIGAYGVEVKDVILGVNTLSLEERSMTYYDNNECAFGYRNSIFKQAEKGKRLVVSVDFRLAKANHVINTSYGAINLELAQKSIQHPTIKDVSDAVICIRQRKLHDPKITGNCGSFFKNPIIRRANFDRLKLEYPEIKSYPTNQPDHVKVPAAWLIERAGWKGKSFGQVAISEKHALVLINLGNATGREVRQLSQDIIDDIRNKFGIELVREVNIIC